MRIGVDMLADQSAGRARGTGRYTRGLMAELLRGPRHEFFLYYYNGLSQSGDLAASRVTVRTLPAGGSLSAAAHELAHENRDGLDVLLLTCPLENFQGYLPPFPSRRGPRLAAIVYDLIPLRFPDHYLRHPGIAQSYRRALAAVRQYDVLLSISESGRRDVLDLLRSSPDRVVNIGAGSDAGFFCPADAEPADRREAQWLAQQGIKPPFVYALTALDYRKNLSGLLAALERLPVQLLDAHQFVVTVASSSERDAQQARDICARSTVGRRVILTESIDDEGLRTLYQNAAAFVFPSRYEGFGLPLVEAMQCGTPVVAGRNSSQIEVVGKGGLLAEVNNPSDLANKIRAMLEDRRLADGCRSRGLKQASRFAWPAVAERCLDTLEATARRAPRSTWFNNLAARGKLAVQERLTRGRAGGVSLPVAVASGVGCQASGVNKAAFSALRPLADPLVETDRSAEA